MVKNYWPKIITLSYIHFSVLNNPLKTDMKNEVIKNKSIGPNNNKKGFNHPHKKVEILDPYHNRTQIAKVAKKSKGVYLFEIENLNMKYVGSSINLYNRVCSYFHMSHTPVKKHHVDLSFPSKLDPWFVTGFCDAESSFYLVVSKSSVVKVGWAVKAVFEIHLHKKDLLLLKKIQSFWGGIGNIIENENSISLKIYLRDLNVLIDHFDKFTLSTQKQADFKLFKRAVELIKNKYHLKPDSLSEIISLKASMNKGLNEELINSFPDIKPTLRPLVNTTKISHPMWEAGFVSGEGSFNISIAKSLNTKTGYRVWLRFQITQHSRDAELLKLLINYFNCGGFYLNQNKEIGDYIVSSLSDISSNIIPFFKKYPILGNKELDFSDFSKALNLIENKKHLEESGLNELIKLKHGMNRGRNK